MISQDDLSEYLESLLKSSSIADYSPNGLQVEGLPSFKKIVTGVTASLALIEAAIEAQADCLLVHHGIFWKGDAYPLVGIKGRRVRTLIENKIALYAYHLPLDMHDTLGNNVQLAHRLGITLEPAGSDLLVRQGHLPQALSGKEFSYQIATALKRQPLHIAGHLDKIKTIAWCTGAGHKALESLPSSIDAFITGEISESAVHVAREKGIHLFAAGHHATERYGIQALGEHLNKKFGIDHTFIDIDSPV